jgi:hypothetical protein
MDSELNLDRFLELGITIFVDTTCIHAWPAILRSTYERFCRMTAQFNQLVRGFVRDVGERRLSLPACVIISA